MAERTTKRRAAGAGPGTPAAGAARKDVEAASLRGRIPTLAAADAEALRAFFEQPRHWALADGGLLRLSATRARADGAVVVDADDARLRLQFDDNDGDGDLPAWSDRRGRARALAWGIAHEARLARLGEAFGAALRPADDDPGDDAPGEALWFEFDVDEDPQSDGAPARTRGLMATPVRWLDRLARRAEPRYAEDPAPPLGRWRDLGEQVSVGFSISPLSRRDWRALRPGDVIVIGRASRPPQFHATAGRSRWPLAPADDGWRVDGAAQALPPEPASPPQDPNRMSENETGNPAQDAEAAAAPAEDPARNLPVRVAFEIGRTELSVGEIADLQPGYVFALPAHLEGANVTILANGHPAGRGEVVAVGDTLGVRLLSWS